MAALGSLLDEPAVRQTAHVLADVLRRLDEVGAPLDAGTLGRLETVALDPSIRVRQREAALDAMRRSDPRAAAVVASRLARDAREPLSVRYAGIAATVDSRDASALDSLLRCFAEDQERRWRRIAALEARHLPEALAMPVLVRGLRDEEPVVRRDAADSSAALTSASAELLNLIEGLANTETRPWRRAHMRRCADDIKVKIEDAAARSSGRSN